jgi:hypothetical protein
MFLKIQDRTNAQKAKNIVDAYHGAVRGDIRRKVDANHTFRR